MAHWKPISRALNRTHLLPTFGIGLPEKDENTLGKLLSGKAYTKENIEKTAETFFSHDDLRNRLRIIESPQQIHEALTGLHITAKPKFLLYAKHETHWVLVVLVSSDSKPHLLYKDSYGGSIPLTLKDALETRHSNIKIIENNKREQEDDVSSGPIVLRNLKLVLDVSSTGTLVLTFAQLPFATQFQIDLARKQLLAENLTDLAKHSEFITKFGEFIDNLPLNLYEDIGNYIKVLDEEKDNNKDGKEKIQQARDQYINDSKLNEFVRHFVSSRNSNLSKDLKLNIEEEYPEQLNRISYVFNYLRNLKPGPIFSEAFNTVSRTLNVDLDKIRGLLEPKSEKQQPFENQREKVRVPSIDEIINKLPKLNEYPPEKNITSLEQLLAESTLGKDEEDYPGQRKKRSIQEYIDIYSKNPELVKIRNKLDRVRALYQEKWADKDARALNEWAIGVKGNLGHSEDELVNAIAALDRGQKLTSGGFRLRDTQLLAVLLFLHNEGSQGSICQIQTGEGKTFIVSFLAVIKALQGNNVDVITSTTLLAKDGLDESELFCNLFGLSVATNNPPGPEKEDAENIAYTADILYGTITIFQNDFLKDVFEGYNVRGGRTFGICILDEVDSMLIDNGGQIATIAASYPGMEFLRYIYIKIWKELQKAEDEYVKEKLHDIEQEFSRLKHGNKTKDQIKIVYDNYVASITEANRKSIKKRIDQSNLLDFKLLPKHLHEYAKKTLKIWLRHAVYAKYECNEHKQYRIAKGEDGEPAIAPIDYLNTGVTLKNTIWSHGLVQFLQLKHNLHLTFENLTSAYVSNLGFIRYYQDNNLFGLTGTIGSRAEQDLLSSVYNINYAKIPPYKVRRFTEIPGIIAEDKEWASTVIQKVIEEVVKGRGVVAIFETERDLFLVREGLELTKKLGLYDIRIRLYAKEEDAKETKDKVKPGDIILATNIGGRGTNFKPIKELEKVGGLHVTVAFVPINLRVEAQAFGRTCRGGNSGTAQLIIKRSEVLRLGLKEADPTFEQIKLARDKLEKERLRDISENVVSVLKFKDDIFKVFAEYHRSLKESKKITEFSFALRDLEEFWAFWLEKKDLNANNLKFTTVTKEFNGFKREISDILAGKIIHNPYYYVALSDFLAEKGKTEKARQALLKAQILAGSKAYLLYGANLKLFEIYLDSSNEIRSQILNEDLNSNSYKSESILTLNRAKEGLQKEIDHIEEKLNIGKLQHLLTFHRDHKNHLFRHLFSRLSILKVHHANILQLLNELKKSRNVLRVNSKTTDYFEKLYEKEKDLSSGPSVFSSEITELRLIGLEALYTLKKAEDVPSTVLEKSKPLIKAGIVALKICKYFNPFCTTAWTIASLLVSEGVIDIAAEQSSNHNKASAVNRAIHKQIVHDTNVENEFNQLVSNALDENRISSKSLEENSQQQQSPKERFDSIVEGLKERLNRDLEAARAEADQKVEPKSKLVVLVDELLDLVNGWDEKKALAIGIADKKIVSPTLHKHEKSALESLRNALKENFKRDLRSDQELLTKLKSASREDIIDIVSSFTNDNDVSQLAKEIATLFLDDFQIADVIKPNLQSIGSIKNLRNPANALAVYLKNELRSEGNDNDVDDILQNIVNKFVEKLFNNVLDESIRIASTSEKVALDQSLNGDELKANFLKLALSIYPNWNRTDPLAKKNFEKLHDNFKAGN